MEFIPIKEIINGKYDGKEVAIRGWIFRTRESGKLIFLTIRDASNMIQAVVSKDAVSEKEFTDTKNALIESSIKLFGKVVKDKRSPGGYELQVAKVEVVGFAERFPITKHQSEDFLLDNRHLWLRSRKMTNILKIRSTVFGAIHEYYRKNGFYEFQSPCFTPTACEGGSTLFEVKYFDRKAFLTQSWQLYAESAIFALEKIYTIAPSFRAEPSKTSRHLTEYWHSEMEIAWGGLEEITKVAEELVSYICQKVVKENEEELKFFNRNKEDLEKITTPFPKLTYTEAIEMLQNEGMEIEWGKDLRTFEERGIVKHFDKPVIITHYPKEIMAFYKPPDEEDEKVALCFDMLANEIGTEIIGGSVRDNDIERMRRILKQQNEKVDTYEWYFDTRRYGKVPHGGFGMGVERVIQWICKLEDIKDAIGFPRTINRINP